MLKSIIVLFFVLVGISTVYGKKLICPSSSAISRGHFDGWIPLNANSNSLADLKSIKAFIANIRNFYLAEYFEDILFNAHCYYVGFQEVYLAREADSKPHAKNWYEEGGRIRCQSLYVQNCPFEHFNNL